MVKLVACSVKSLHSGVSWNEKCDPNLEQEGHELASDPDPLKERPHPCQ